MIFRKIVTGALTLLAVAGVSLLAWHNAQPPQHCAAGMVAHGARCCGVGQSLQAGRCSGEPKRCAESMHATPAGCVPRRSRIQIHAGELKLAPSDWEATQRVAPYRADIDAFLIDSHEVTEQDWSGCVSEGKCPALTKSGEPGRARVGVSATEAATYCQWSGGALPSRDQLAYAAMGPEITTDEQ